MLEFTETTVTEDRVEPIKLNRDLSPFSKVKLKFLGEKRSKVFQSQVKKEIIKFQSLPEAEKQENVLDWWKFYGKSMPTLSSIE